MAKIKLLKLQLPKNYRRITEKTAILAVALAISSLILFITLLVTQIFNDYREFEKISQERAELSSKLNSWSSILDRFPGYSDASFNIALTYFQLNNLAKAREYLNKTFSFDPNYPGAEMLDMELKKRDF
jgi:tetratricopeptide (TPR) repeat protein